MKRSKEEIAGATDELATIIELLCMERTKNGRKPAVYRVVRHITKSGATEISFYVADKHGDLQCLDYLVSCVTGRPFGKHGGLRMPFVNMDPAFELFNRAMCAVFPHPHPLHGWQPRLRLERL